jgi:hypothetical protein
VSGLEFVNRNDTENLSVSAGLSPKLGGWPIYSTSFLPSIFNVNRFTRGWCSLRSLNRNSNLRFGPQAEDPRLPVVSAPHRTATRVRCLGAQVLARSETATRGSPGSVAEEEPVDQKEQMPGQPSLCRHRGKHRQAAALLSGNQRLGACSDALDYRDSADLTPDADPPPEWEFAGDIAEENHATPWGVMTGLRPWEGDYEKMFEDLPSEMMKLERR